MFITWLTVVPPEGQVACQQVGKNKAPPLTHVHAGVGRRTAGIHGHLTGRYRPEKLLFTGHGIEKPEIYLFLDGKQRGGEVTFTAVGENHHQRPLLQGPGSLGGHHHGGTAAHAHHEPSSRARRRVISNAVLIVNVDLFVQQGLFEYFRLVGLASCS
jgi:hypothetical protein